MSLTSNESDRRQSKTPEQNFIRALEIDFHFPPRVAQAVLEEAQCWLYGQDQPLRPGQIRVILTHRDARPGRPLAVLDKSNVTWTIDAGVDDQMTETQYGRVALRHVRIQRLVLEALEQDAVATQEDLASALHVSVRTIKRDIIELESKQVYLPTRGNLHAIGRGQTHKAQIIRLWLQGQTYDRISLKTHHSTAAIKRYIQTFVRVVELHQRRFSNNQVGQLLQIGSALVAEYLAVYRENNAPDCRERLSEQLQRLVNLETSPKKTQCPRATRQSVRRMPK